MAPLKDSDTARLRELRLHRAEERKTPPSAVVAPLTLGQQVADQVAVTMGSWPFIIIQSVVLMIWIILNVTAYIARWDPYPFILLNLALSFQAAYAAPVIMMSQNRQQDIDRREAASDYRINVKAELEIELLHDKIDALREREVLALTQGRSRVDTASAGPRVDSDSLRYLSRTTYGLGTMRWIASLSSKGALAMLSTKTAKGTRQVQFRYISPSVPLHWTLPGRKSGTVSL